MILEIKKSILQVIWSKKSSLYEKRNEEKTPTNLIEYIFCTNIYLYNSMKRAWLWKMKVKKSSGMISFLCQHLRFHKWYGKFHLKKQNMLKAINTDLINIMILFVYHEQSLTCLVDFEQMCKIRLGMNLQCTLSLKLWL